MAGTIDARGADRGRATPPTPEPRLSRRSFLAASGLGTASLLVPGLWAPARAADPWARADAIVAGIKVPTFPARDFPITRETLNRT